MSEKNGTVKKGIGLLPKLSKVLRSNSKLPTGDTLEQQFKNIEQKAKLDVQKETRFRNTQCTPIARK